jgi:ribulose-phosphate 3-epimerase
MTIPRPTKASLIAPSILSADFVHLAEEIARVEAAGADVLHVDVMDGHFVPNLTFGPPVIKAIRGATSLPLDTHLMISNAERYVQEYADAGCDWLTVHVEAATHLHSVIQQIRSAGMKPGVALNPHTSPEALRYVLPELHHVLVMSVNPGFGGQRFIPSTLQKLAQLREWIDAQGLEVRLEVDGGVNVDNIGAIRAAGADTFVAGSAIFKSQDYARTIANLRAASSPS